MCSLLQEIDGDDSSKDMFTLVIPKRSMANKESSFFNLEVSMTLETAKKQLAECSVAVETAKQALIDDNSYIRFRGSEAG